eukprot:GAFH01000184.1.p1 GENE.GAFH01000184.1~~GAFH01000184.1.p1  ORF type:complete len:418 (-),score=151.54 GAFH01000184.1:115-1323(-)
MGCKLGSCLIHIIDILFLCLGLICIIVGAVIWARIGLVIAWMPICCVFVGAALLLVTILGCAGAGFDKNMPNEKPCAKWSLVIYFFCVLIIALALGVAATLCLVAWAKVKAIVIANLPMLLEKLKDVIADYAPEQAMDDVDRITEYIMSNLKICGIICVVMAGLVFLGLVVAGFHLGGRLVFKHTLSFGNLVLILAGGMLIALGIYVYTIGLVEGKGVPLAIGILGIAVCCIAALGFFATCCTGKACSKVLLCFYLVIMILIVLAVVILGIVCAAFTDTVGSTVDSFCSKNTTAPLCEKAFTMLCDPTVGMNCTGLTNTTAMISAVKNYVMGNLKMVGAAAIWIGVWMIYLILAGFINCCLPERADNEGASKEEIKPGQAGAMPNYASQAQPATAAPAGAGY